MREREEAKNMENDEHVAQEGFNEMEGNQWSQEYYQQYIPMYTNAANSSSGSGNGELLEKLNYMKTGSGEFFISQGRKACEQPFQRLLITYDGRVSMCCYDWGAKHTVACLKDLPEDPNYDKISSFCISPALKSAEQDFFPGIFAALKSGSEPPNQASAHGSSRRMKTQVKDEWVGG